MVLSKRERIIVIVSIAALVILVLDRYALTPLLDADARVETALAAAKDKQAKDMRLIRQAAGTTSKRWNEMIEGGLKSDPAQSEGQVLHALEGWASEAGLSPLSMKPERVTQTGELREITVQAAGTGSMSAVAGFLWRIESSQMPLRTRDLQLSARREGADDLSMTVRVSTLYLAPQSAKAPPAAAAAKPTEEAT